MLYEYTLADLHYAIDLTPAKIEADISIYYGAFFQVLKQTGCRPIEITDRSRWSYAGGTDFYCQAAKGSGIRTIDGSFFPEIFKDFLFQPVGSNTDFSRISKTTTLRYWYDYFSPAHYYFTSVENSQSQGMYIFRHMYVKDLLASGLTEKQIQTHMAAADIQNIQGYLDSKSYCSFPPK